METILKWIHVWFWDYHVLPWICSNNSKWNYIFYHILDLDLRSYELWWMSYYVRLYCIYIYIYTRIHVYTQYISVCNYFCTGLWNLHSHRHCPGRLRGHADNAWGAWPLFVLPSIMGWILARNTFWSFNIAMKIAHYIDHSGWFIY